MTELNKIEQQFLLESNSIEGIHRELKEREIIAFQTFMSLEKITIEDLQYYVSYIQPTAILRDKDHLNVTVGSHFPPKGGVAIRYALQELLDKVNSGMISAYEAHIAYETLHPFTDGNGRSGRMLWWWMMNGSQLGFLHKFYYQTLENSR